MLVATRLFLGSAQQALEQHEYSRAIIEANNVIDGVANFKASGYAYRNLGHRRELGSLLREAHLVNVEALLAIALAQFRNLGYTLALKSTLNILLHDARETQLPILKDIQTLQRRLEDTIA